MSEQTRLFEVQPDHSMARPRGAWVPAVETPAARATDPETSHEAAEEITASGDRGSQQRAVLALVRWFPGSTAGELATYCAPGDEALSKDEGKRYYQIQRRASELEPRYVKPRKDASKRRCRARGTMATELWPVEARI